jgi:hypothetical protein
MEPGVVELRLEIKKINRKQHDDDDDDDDDDGEMRLSRIFVIRNRPAA